MSEKDICILCGCQAEKSVNYDPMSVFYSCPVCGRYEITETELLNSSILKNRLKHFLYYKGFRRNKKITEDIEYRYYTTMSKEKCDVYTGQFNAGNNSHGHPVHVDQEIVNAWYPRSFAEKIDLILLKLAEQTEYVGQSLCLSKPELFSCMFVDEYRNSGEKRDESDRQDQMFYFVDYLSESGFIEKKDLPNDMEKIRIRITPLGYRRIDELQRNTGDGRNVLVAMQFGEDTQLLRNAIKKGISEAGFFPILIDEVEHNELITPELLSYIKNSRFVVVDLTHKNNGAYFEEGYAMGLGKPVIQLCQKGTKLHFDIAQKNTIMWDFEDDIPLKLKNRIKATIE